MLRIIRHEHQLSGSGCQFLKLPAPVAHKEPADTSLFERLNSQSGGRENTKFVSASIVAKGKATVTRKAPATAKKKAVRKLDSDDEEDDFADAPRLAAIEEPDVLPNDAQQPRRAAAVRAQRFTNFAIKAIYALRTATGQQLDPVAVRKA